MSTRELRREQRQQLTEHRRFRREHLKELDRKIRTRRKQSERYKPEARWPYIVTALLFAVSFVPIAGWVNVLAFPALVAFWVVIAARSSFRYRPYGIALLFAFLNGVLSLCLQINYLFHWN